MRQVCHQKINESKRNEVMQSVIDVINHISKYAKVYHFYEPVGDEVRADALDLCLRHGDDFVITFIENYINLAIEESV